MKNQSLRNAFAVSYLLWIISPVSSAFAPDNGTTHTPQAASPSLSRRLNIFVFDITSSKSASDARTPRTPVRTLSRSARVSLSEDVNKKLKSLTDETSYGQIFSLLISHDHKVVVSGSDQMPLRYCSSHYSGLSPPSP